MSKNDYSHIKSFSDFREERMRLYYEIRLSEKKLEIKKMELQAYINPIRFFSSIFNDIARPLFDFFKGFLQGYKQKKAQQKADKNKSSETTAETSAESPKD